ncbi:bestrophin [bacterium]|nr:bestrophin [bacterium]
MAFNAEKSSSKEQIHWLSLMGSCASILCVIHCFGTAILSLLAPAIIHMIPHSTSVELGIWFFAAACALFTFWRMSPSRLVWPPLLAIIFVGSVLFLEHRHQYSPIALFVLAVYQLSILGFYHFQKNGSSPTCCLHTPSEGES